MGLKVAFCNLKISFVHDRYRFNFFCHKIGLRLTKLFDVFLFAGTNLVRAGFSADLCRFVENGYMGQENFLSRKLEERRAQDALRRLRLPDGKADFCSNDYLGVVTKGLLTGAVGEEDAHGSGGSRLLAGNYALIEAVETAIADFHGAEAGLIFNSGYDANLGLLSCVPRRGDVVLYDALSHASIRDGIRLSFARAYAFAHNDLGDLERQLIAARGEDQGTAGTDEAEAGHAPESEGRKPDVHPSQRGWQSDRAPKSEGRRRSDGRESGGGVRRGHCDSEYIRGNGVGILYGRKGP